VLQHRVPVWQGQGTDGGEAVGAHVDDDGVLALDRRLVTVSVAAQDVVAVDQGQQDRLVYGAGAGQGDKASAAV